MSDANNPAEPEQLEPEWPAHFPPACPPRDAEDLRGTVYMLVATDPPTPTDMECAIDRRTFIGKPECARASLSCARDPEHLADLRRNSKRMRNFLIASAAFSAEHGKIMQTGGPEHYSMWLRRHALSVAHTMFTVPS